VAAPKPQLFDSRTNADSMKVTDTFVSKGDCALPCHVQHGSCRNEIQWDISPEEMRAQVWPLLILAASGLQECTHPCAIKSRKGFADLCRTITIVDPKALRQVTNNLRKALTIGLEKADNLWVLAAVL